MPEIPIEKLLPKANQSVYTLVKLASQRALELADGKRPLVDTKSDKLTTLALSEIANGRVVLKGAEQFLAKQESKATPEEIV